jgi:hypothetical protein
LLRPDGVVNPYNHKSYMDTYDFRVGCDLNYNVNGPSAFIFNVSVVNNSFQRILTEAFTTEPQLQVEESRSPIEEKRLHRLSAGAGPLRVQYSATVELSHYVQPAESVPETPPGALPAAVVPYLYPSRYCEADILVRLAQHEFGKLQPGFSRVTAICNWIHDNVEYLRGSTNPHTSAYDTATETCGRVSRFRSPCHCLLPGASGSGAIRGGLRIRLRTRRFSGLFRSVSRWTLVYLRSDTPRTADRIDSHRHGPRRCRYFVRNAIWSRCIFVDESHHGADGRQDPALQDRRDLHGRRRMTNPAFRDSFRPPLYRACEWILRRGEARAYNQSRLCQSHKDTPEVECLTSSGP